MDLNIIIIPRRGIFKELIMLECTLYQRGGEGLILYPEGRREGGEDVLFKLFYTTRPVLRRNFQSNAALMELKLKFIPQLYKVYSAQYTVQCTILDLNQ